MQFTKRVTRHPVCMTVYGVKPPCLPYHAYSATGKPCNGVREDAEADFEDEDEIYGDLQLKEEFNDRSSISPTSVVV